ncbi:hypothetical protein D9Q98_002475 [Chlorella vulgaris]|uniref:CENP-V/GFA domain-containing protein n=1 Tax=Chlorella vulgaris TaxID=3077 RepID=A0A9D4TTI1_CHLVU|nr:hypothetical protein D9Q98_002475 [Chlorella vulgaris]
MALVTHQGQCHCGVVRFEFDEEAHLVAWDCDCSICSMKRNTRIIIPASRFRLLQGQDALSCYQFGTKTAQHLFCKTCGICPFYRPRSKPDGYAVTLHCITSPTVAGMEVKQIGGSEWEAAMAASGTDGSVR